MVLEDDKKILQGPPGNLIQNISVGTLIYNSLHEHLNKNQALVDIQTGKTLSYRELLGLTCSLAESLSSIRYGKNTMIAVSSENNVQFYIPVIAALYIGAVVVPINFNYTSHELLHSLNLTKPQIIFCSKAVASKYISIKQKLKFIDLIIVIDFKDSISGSESLINFIQNNLRHDGLVYKTSIADIDPKEHVALVMSSSGTTGLPKGVMLTHYNIMTWHQHILAGQYYAYSGNILGIAPFFHSYGFMTNLGAIIRACKILVMSRFEERLFLETIQNYKISSLTITPPLVVLLTKSPLVNNYDLSSVKDLFCASASLSRDTEKSVLKRLNNARIRQAYGLTETTAGVTINSVNRIKHGSAGNILPHILCKIRDPETGKSLERNKVGEICVKGSTVMKGYYNNENATKGAFTSDGWLLTGDLGYFDDDGYLFIVGRLKELIKYKGFQVAPAELEAILLSNPKIKDCGVIGFAHEDIGELPTAFVVKNPNVNLTEKEVEEFVAQKVSSQKRLRGGVIFVSEIPKNYSGKILRKDLHTMLTRHKLKL